MQARHVVDEILALIERTKKEWLTRDPYPHLPSLRLALEAECINEFWVIQSLLSEPKTFASKIRERCITRAHNAESTVSFACLSDTPLNQFYWQLVQLVFQPKTLQKMLKIILPDIKFQVDVQAGAENIEITPLNLGDTPPEAHLLANYVMTLDTLLDVRQLSALSEEKQRHVRNILAEQLPEMHTSLQTYLKIKAYANARLAAQLQPETPRTAALRLSLELKVTDAGRSGYSSDATYLAISQFMRALNAAPNESAAVILNELNIHKDDCTRELSDNLLSIARHYEEVWCQYLDAELTPQPPLATEPDPAENMLALVDNELTPQANIPTLLKTHLLPNFASKIEVNEKFILINTPLPFLDKCLRNLKMLSTNNILEMIRLGYFNHTQTTHLIRLLARKKTIVVNCSFLDWLKKVSSQNIVSAVLDGVPMMLSTDAIVELLNRYFHSHREFTINLAKEAANYFGERLFTHPAGTWLQRIDHMDLLIAATPKSKTRKDLIRFLREPDKKGQTVLHVSNRIEVVKLVIEETPAKTYRKCITHTNRQGVTALHLNNKQDVINKMLVTAIPPCNRYDVLTKPRYQGVSLLFHHATGTGIEGISMMTIMMTSLPANQRLRAALHTCTYKKRETNLICRIARNGHVISFRCFLSNIPKHERLKAILGNNDINTAECALPALTEHPETLLLTALELLPPSDRPTLLVVTINGKIRSRAKAILTSLLNNHPHLVPDLFRLLPVETQFNLLEQFPHLMIRLDEVRLQNILEQLPDGARKTKVLQRLLSACNLPKGYIVITKLVNILKRLPPNARLNHLVLCTSLEVICAKFGALSKILPELPPQDRYKLLCTRLPNGKTVFEAALHHQCIHPLEFMTYLSFHLPDNDGFSLLYSAYENTTLLNHTAAWATSLYKRVYSPELDPLDFKNWCFRLQLAVRKDMGGFIYNFFLLYCYLYSEHKDSRESICCFGLFANNDPLGKTMKALQNCQTLGELKAAVAEHLPDLYREQPVEYRDVLNNLGVNRQAKISHMRLSN